MENVRRIFEHKHGPHSPRGPGPSQCVAAARPRPRRAPRGAVPLAVAVAGPGGAGGSWGWAMERGAARGFLAPFGHFATQAIHAGQEPEQWRSGAVVPPVSLSTTFKQRAPGQHAVSAAGAAPAGLGAWGREAEGGGAGAGPGWGDLPRGFVHPPWAAPSPAGTPRHPQPAAGGTAAGGGCASCWVLG